MSASGSTPALLESTSVLLQARGLRVSDYQLHEEALYSDILLWACCPIGAGAWSTLNAAEKRGQATRQRVIPQQSNFQFLH